MQMTEEEIVRSYRLSAEPRKQINVLADLNCTTPQTIKDILKDHGIETSKPGPKPKAMIPIEKTERTIPKSVEQVLKVRLGELSELEQSLKKKLEETARDRKELEDYIKSNGGSV